MNASHSIKKLRFRKWGSLCLLFLGIVLLVFMIVVEDEPGGVPVLLILTGSMLYFHTRKKIKER